MRPADPVPTDDPVALRDLAGSLARDAGRVAYAGRRAARDAAALGGTTKSTGTDIVTEFDRAAESEIVAHLRRDRPDDAIVGEEGTADSGTSGYSWFIDPIDGTTSFVYDQPTWSCSVAVAREGTMLAGAVYIPPLDELFDAACDQSGAAADSLLETLRKRGALDDEDCDLLAALVQRHLARHDNDPRQSLADCDGADEVRQLLTAASAGHGAAPRASGETIAFSAHEADPHATRRDDPFTTTPVGV